MFCPGCGGEFRRGIATCPDCSLPLVDQPAAAAASGAGGLEPVLRSHSPETLQAFTARLRAAGVPYAEQSGTALALFEGGRLFGGRRADEWEGRVWVLASEMEAALALRDEPEGGEDPSLEEWPAAEDGESLGDYETRINPRSR